MLISMCGELVVREHPSTAERSEGECREAAGDEEDDDSDEEQTEKEEKEEEAAIAGDEIDADAAVQDRHGSMYFFSLSWSTVPLAQPESNRPFSMLICLCGKGK